jgi:hypothetical protein
VARAVAVDADGNAIVAWWENGSVGGYNWMVRVYDPAGKNPLYNVIVYVPNAPLAPITHGATCETCNTAPSGTPIASALTDTHGRFKIEKNALGTNIPPSGTDIPLVIQIGKWRRQIKLGTVKP